MDTIVIIYLFVVYRAAKRYACRGRANAIIISIVFLILWIVYGHRGQSPYYYHVISFNKANLLAIAAYTISLIVMIPANVYFIRWARAGNDFRGLVQLAKAPSPSALENDGNQSIASGEQEAPKPDALPWVRPNVIIGQVLWEEILYRGLVFLLVATFLGVGMAIALQASMFAYLHFWPMRLAARSQGVIPGRFIYSSFIFIVLASSLFAYFNTVFGALWPGWLMHAMLNYAVETKGGSANANL